MMNRDILFLNNKDMKILGAEDMQFVLDNVKKAYSLFIKKDVYLPDKTVMRFGKTIEDEVIHGRINCMPGYLGDEYNMAGIKWVGSGPQNYKLGLPRASAIVVLNDPDTKFPVCIADGTAVSAKRTGASGGVAMEYLSNKNSRVLTICGAGVQARTQLEAAMIVRPGLQTVYVYDIVMNKARQFAEEMSKKYQQISIVPVEFDVLPSIIEKSDIVITVTLAKKPFIKGKWLSKGTLLLNMSGYEVDYDCVSIADKVVVDFWDSVKHRKSGTVSIMYADGLFSDEQLFGEIGEIILENKKGRNDANEIIYYNAVGAGLLDLSIVVPCYKKALQEDVGIALPYWR